MTADANCSLSANSSSCAMIPNCTYVPAIAAVAGISCQQPGVNDSVCPNNSTHCVFTPSGQVGVAGYCGLSTQATCTAALNQDSNGSACIAAGCLYTPVASQQNCTAALLDTTSATCEEQGCSYHEPRTVSIEVSTLVDGVFGEALELMQVWLSSPQNALLADPTMGLTEASIFITNAEVCDGWPRVHLCQRCG